MNDSLTSTVAVMDALGGTEAVAKLTGRTYRAAFNWRSFDVFPSNTFVVMNAALKARGLNAPPSLWGMVEQPSEIAGAAS